MKSILDSILLESANFIKDGEVASYIPELAKANKNALGICVTTNEGMQCASGDADQFFTMQSIVKPLILLFLYLPNEKPGVCGGQVYNSGWNGIGHPQMFVRSSEKVHCLQVLGRESVC